LLIESGEVALTRLRELIRFDETIDKLKEPVPSKKLDQKFYICCQKKRASRKRFDFASWFFFRILDPKLAVTMVLWLFGFIGGTVCRRIQRGVK